MESQGGLFVSLKTLASTLLGIARTRLELLANEFQEERIRLTRMLVFGALALFFFSLGVLLLSVLVIAVFWDTHRLLAIAGVALVHFGIALYCLLAAHHQAHRKTSLFSASLAELDKDRAALAQES